ncbi:MAG: hypothetical protein JNJ41_19945 [Bacteroidia bacterium]|nr:hypothetical protein [Bacteroidia bacterium]
MKKRLFIFILLPAALGLLSNCKKKEKKDDLNNLDCSAINSGYSSDIKPIIAANCNSSGCHNAGSANGDLTTYNGIKAKVDNGSLDNRVIQQRTMPLSGSLAMDDLKKIKCWLNSGAPNN